MFTLNITFLQSMILTDIKSFCLCQKANDSCAEKNILQKIRECLLNVASMLNIL